MQIFQCFLLQSTKKGVIKVWIIGRKMRQFILSIAVILGNADLTAEEKVALIDDELRTLKFL